MLKEQTVQSQESTKNIHIYTYRSQGYSDFGGPPTRISISRDFGPNPRAFTTKKDLLASIWSTLYIHIAPRNHIFIFGGLGPVLNRFCRAPLKNTV